METKRRWVETRAIFANDYSELGIGGEIEELFYFDANEVTAFNVSSDETRTTIWFMGTSITITMPISKVRKLILNENE